MENFIIVRLDSHWRLALPDGSHIAFDRRTDALKEAVNAAHRAGLSGKEACVLSQDQTGALLPIWTYGVDAINILRNRS